MVTVSDLDRIGAEYCAAPTATRAAAELWREYVPWIDAAAAAAVKRYGVTVRVVDDADPYESAETMAADIRGGRFLVSRVNADHPVFDRATIVRQRIGHDLLGHYANGAGFDAAGEIHACLSVLPTIPRRFWAVELCETIGQTAEYIVAGGFETQRAAILADSLPILRARS